MLGLSIDKTKMYAAIFSNGGDFVYAHSCDTPQDSYRDTLLAAQKLITKTLSDPKRHGTSYDGPVGVALPGAITNNVISHSALAHLNGEDVGQDLQAVIGRAVYTANLGDCFTHFEATKGVAAGNNSVFGMYIDACCYGGLAINGMVLTGKNGITGNWAHLPLPSPVPYELDGQDCWCGRTGCLECFLSATGLEDDYFKITENRQSASQIATAAANSDIVAESALQVLEDRLGRATAAIINLIDPDAIVLGGMVGQLGRLASNVPRKWPGYVIEKRPATALLTAHDSTRSVLAGAAHLAKRA